MKRLKPFLKTFLQETIRNILGHVLLALVDVWFQDEARFGQQNTTTRIWAPKGTRPRAVRQQQFEYAYLFGAVCPSNGQTQAIIAPCSNGDIMKEHLALISQNTAPERYAVVIMDGASWHQSYLADDFDNLCIIKLPPYSPELNAVEQVWQWMRQNEIANRCFDGYEDIVDKCSKAWNRFREDKNRVKKLCNRDWINLVN